MQAGGFKLLNKYNRYGGQVGGKAGMLRYVVDARGVASPGATLDNEPCNAKYRAGNRSQPLPARIGIPFSVGVWAWPCSIILCAVWQQLLSLEFFDAADAAAAAAGSR